MTEILETTTSSSLKKFTKEAVIIVVITVATEAALEGIEHGWKKIRAKRAAKKAAK